MLWVRVEGLTWSNFFDALIITFRYHSQTLAVTIFCVKVSCQSDREKTCQLPTENNASFKHSSCISHIKVTFETWLVLCQITVRNDCLGEALWPSFLWNILVTGKISDSFPKTVQFDSIQFNNPLVRLNPVPGGSTHILMTGGGGGGVWRIFLGLTFWPKGIFLGLWKTPIFFWVTKTTQGFFWVLYFSSAQINNDISAIYCLCGITGTEYVKPVNLQHDSVKNIQLLVKPYKLLHDHVFARSSVTEEVSISDVISPVSLTRRREEFQLSLADATYLEVYFPLDNYGDTSEYMADDGRRVQLSRTRTGWLRRAVVYTAH